MELNKGHIIFGVVCLVAGVLLGFFLKGCSGTKLPEDPKPIVLHDTINIHDTLRIAEHTKPLYVIKWDTLYLEKPASQDTMGDSLCDGYVTIPITQYEYRDTFKTDSSRIELGIRYEGYRAKIDGIDINSQYTIQHRTIEKKNGWGQFIGIGVGVGYGASVVGHTVYAAPEVGLHITYGWGYSWRK